MCVCREAHRSLSDVTIAGSRPDNLTSDVTGRVGDQNTGNFDETKGKTSEDGSSVPLSPLQAAMIRLTRLPSVATRAGELLSVLSLGRRDVVNCCDDHSDGSNHYNHRVPFHGVNRVERGSGWTLQRHFDSNEDGHSGITAV